MTIAEIGKDLVELCRRGKNLEAIDKHYSTAIVSEESFAPPGMEAQTKGLEGVRHKNEWWIENHEVHSARADGPYVGEHGFAVEYEYDVTQKASGKRFKMSEMALYTVDGGKIVREHFFYNAGGA